MMRRALWTFFFLAVLGSLARQAPGITYATVEVVCPICQTKNTFTTWASSGGYVYFWPSRFQMVFWPYTDPVGTYHCRNCHYSVFEWDFANPPEEKLAAIRQLLQSVSCPRHADDYLKMPVSDRLAIAEQVYRLFEPDERFWCSFYRVLGYHLHEEGRKKEAAEARRRALKLAHQLLQQAELEGERKEILAITAAMHHYLESDPQALRALREAESIAYRNPNLDAEKNDEINTYLAGLIRDYIRAIEEGRNTDEEGSSPPADEEK